MEPDLSKMTTPLAQKRSLILMKSRFMGAAREISKFHNWSLLINSQHCCICLAEIMPQGVNPYSINQSHTRNYFCHWRIFCDGGSFGHLWNYGGCGRCNLRFCRPKIKNKSTFSKWYSGHAIAQEPLLRGSSNLPFCYTLLWSSLLYI